MKDLLRMGGMGGFVLLGLWAAWATRRGRAVAGRGVGGRGVAGRLVAGQSVAGRPAVNVFLAYTLVVSFGAGLLQRDLWPFTNWPLVAGLQAPTVRYTRLMAVDQQGQEHDVDYRAWQPFVIEELLGWADARMPALEAADRASASAFLVGLVERGRQQAARGEGVGYFDRLWGPFAAPYFLLHPAWWDSPATTPSVAFVGLRLYHESWNLEERRVNPSAMQRSLVYEYLPR